MIRAQGLHGVALPAPASARLLADIGLTRLARSAPAATAAAQQTPPVLPARAQQAMAILRSRTSPVTRRDLCEVHGCSPRLADTLIAALNNLAAAGLVQAMVLRRGTGTATVTHWALTETGQHWQASTVRRMDDAAILRVMARIAARQPSSGCRAMLARSPRGYPATASTVIEGVRADGYPGCTTRTMRARLDDMAARGLLATETVQGAFGPLPLYWPIAQGAAPACPQGDTDADRS